MPGRSFIASPCLGRVLGGPAQTVYHRVVASGRSGGSSEIAKQVCNPGHQRDEKISPQPASIGVGLARSGQPMEIFVKRLRVR